MWSKDNSLRGTRLRRKGEGRNKVRENTKAREGGGRKRLQEHATSTLLGGGLGRVKKGGC